MKGILEPVYNVCLAADSIEALEKMQESKPPFDLIITDIYHGWMNGIEMIMEIRKHNIDIPIIVVSGNITSKVIELFKNGLFPVLMSKPYKSKYLLKIVQQLLSIS